MLTLICELSDDNDEADADMEDNEVLDMMPATLVTSDCVTINY